MKIDFIINSLGLFGSVRELIETGNVLSRLGHNVTAWCKTDQPCQWLTQEFRTKTYTDHPGTLADALILMDSPTPDVYGFFRRSRAKFKTLVLSGFYPDRLAHLLADQETEMPLAVDVPLPEGTLYNLLEILDDYTICADSAWQLEFLRQHGIRIGAALGGVNCAMFYPEPDVERDVPLLISGDPRARKGTALLKRALDGLSVDTYWGTKEQNELRRKLSSALIFVDNETCAGWCNPVLEAMACGAACITSDIGAVQEFAVDGETALLVPPNDEHAIRKAVLRLLADDALRLRLSAQGAAKARAFSYEIVAARFAAFLFWMTHD